MEIPFLTEIAREYNDKISGVFFGGLAKNHLARVTASKDRGRFSIYIDDNKSKCSFQRLFCLFHEIAHVELRHFGERFCSKNQPGQTDAMDKEADEWAFQAMGMIDEKGEVKECDQACHDCILATHYAYRPCPKNVVRR